MSFISYLWVFRHADGPGTAFSRVCFMSVCRIRNERIKDRIMKQDMTIEPSMKLADLIELNYRLLDVLSRLGVGLGFGEHTITDACRTFGISESAFLLICNEYTFEGYVPGQELLSSADAEDIMKYLHNSHMYYMDREMEHLRSSLARLLAPVDAAQRKVVEKFFADYKAEVKNHFDYEEDVVFPYVNALLEGASRNGYSIGQFEENHSNIDEKLNDLKNIVMKYLPDVCDPVLRNEVLYHIFYLEDDLHHHTLIEDNVLVPMVDLLERKFVREAGK